MQTLIFLNFLIRIEKVLKSDKKIVNFDFSLSLYGSVVNGFWTDKSDIDISMNFSDTKVINPVFFFSISIDVKLIYFRKLF